MSHVCTSTAHDPQAQALAKELGMRSLVAHCHLGHGQDMDRALWWGCLWLR